jgi:hypothetical protein
LLIVELVGEGKGLKGVWQLLCIALGDVSQIFGEDECLVCEITMDTTKDKISTLSSLSYLLITMAVIKRDNSLLAAGEVFGFDHNPFPRLTFWIQLCAKFVKFGLW